MEKEFRVILYMFDLNKISHDHIPLIKEQCSDLKTTEITAKRLLVHMSLFMLSNFRYKRGKYRFLCYVLLSFPVISLWFRYLTKSQDQSLVH